MEEKLLIIRHCHLGFHVHANMYVRTKNGAVYMGEFTIREGEEWESVRKAIDAEYIDLDKSTEE